MLDKLHQTLNKKDDFTLQLWIMGIEKCKYVILCNLYCKLYIFLAYSINIQSRRIFWQDQVKYKTDF